MYSKIFPQTKYVSKKKAKIPKFQGPKTEVISILKNARFTGSGAKS